MKYLIVLIVFTISPILSKSQHGHEITATDRPSTHGMVVFGKEKIYASHLPLFHAPHDYQIILELEFDKAGKKLFTENQKKYSEFSTYTIEPEKFILPEKINSKGIFKANLYRGHFERGGVKVAENITIKIIAVIYFSKFDPSAEKAATGDFILFGNSAEQFAVHRISNKPDFDQIILVKSDFAIVEKDGHQIASLNKRNEPLGVSGNTIDVEQSGQKLNLILLKQLYLEFEDLLE